MNPETFKYEPTQDEQTATVTLTVRILDGIGTLPASASANVCLDNFLYRNKDCDPELTQHLFAVLLEADAFRYDVMNGVYGYKLTDIGEEIRKFGREYLASEKAHHVDDEN